MDQTLHVIFQNRDDAGKRLAKRLSHYRNSDAVVLGIPRGGVPVASAAAHRLQLSWNVIVARKLPIPWNPEAGFGAVTADGSVVLNEPMLDPLGISNSDIDKVVGKVRSEVERTTTVFASIRPSIELTGKCTIVVDDGLASGYTMLAAIKSLRACGASKVIAAAPVASRLAALLVERVADECVFEIISAAVPFAVADFYLDWHDLSDADVINLLKLASP